MKKNIIYILVIFLLGGSSCSKKTKEMGYTAQVVSLKSNTTNQIYLQAKGMGNSEQDAAFDAEKNAFNSLLFRGITGVQEISPLVADEEKSKSANKKFYFSFFQDRGYNKFIVSSEKIPQKIDKKNMVVISKLKINIAALRVYLEQNGVVRKFGW